MAFKGFGFTNLIGGITGSLDNKNTTSAVSFPDGSVAFGIDPTFGGVVYKLDRSSSAAESLPDVVKPDTGTGRWLLQGAFVPVATGSVDGLLTAANFTKLAGIETGADVTDATNVAAAGAILNGGVGTITSLTVTDIDASTRSGDQNYQDNKIIRPLLQDYAAESNTVNSSSGTLTLDMAIGNSFFTDLSVSGENITTITISNAPTSGNLAGIVWTFDQDSTPRTITVPGAWIVVGGTAPDPSGASTKHKWFLQFDDGGTIVYLAVLENFS